MVLQLLADAREPRELVLQAGLAVPPFAIGAHPTFAPVSERFAGAHVMAAFNGHTLFVCSLHGENARLGGARLDARGVEVVEPVELCFGGARINIRRQSRAAAPTYVVDAEATRIAAVIPKARRAQAQDHADELTRIDETALATALRRSIPDAEATRIVDVDVPAAAKGPSNQDVTLLPSPPTPAARPVTRTVQLVRRRIRSLPDAAVERVEEAPLSPASELTAQVLAGLDARRREARFETPARARVRAEELAPPSSVPPTIPTDRVVFAAAPQHFPPTSTIDATRPSSPTIAIPPLAARTDGSVADADAGDRLTPPPHSVDTHLHPLADARTGESPAAGLSDRPPSPFERKLAAVRSGWRQASVAKKAIAVLIGVLLVVALSQLRSASTPQGAIARSSDAIVVQGDAGGLQTSAPAEARQAASPRQGSGAPPSRELRDAERRALDTAASGLDSAAAEQYEALALAHPENIAFREAARILRGRAPTHRE
ncbi:MAG: hypothetical protein KF819_04280 [Labilithrix sp.]|nr:hypothetical protein [Labilithrix sp.]